MVSPLQKGEYGPTRKSSKHFGEVSILGAIFHSIYSSLYEILSLSSYLILIFCELALLFQFLEKEHMKNFI